MLLLLDMKVLKEGISKTSWLQSANLQLIIFL